MVSLESLMIKALLINLLLFQIHNDASVPQHAQGGGRSGGTARNSLRIPAEPDHPGCDAPVEDTARRSQGECVGARLSTKRII